MALPVASIHAEAAAVLAGTAVALFIKGVALSYVQVRFRFRSRAFERAEDARLMGVPVRPEPDIVHRSAGAWRNEHENTPPFMAMATGYVLLGGGAHTLLPISALYVTARFIQAYAQIRTMQPHRTYAYLVGLAASLVLAGFTMSRAWSVWS